MGWVTRRDFITTLGVAAGGGALAFAPDLAVRAFKAAWGEDWVELPVGTETWITSLCRQCPGGCGIRIRMNGNNPVKIEGNPFHPVNRGKLCPKGQSALLSLNDPDRIRGPLQRVGKRGAGQWREISWNDAIKLVVTQLQEIRRKNIPQTLAIMDGDTGSLTRKLWERFFYQFGSPNYINIPTGLDHGTVDAYYLMQGAKANVVYDMGMANYIVSFGSDFLQSSWSPVQTMNAFGYMRRGRDIRGKLIQVESCYSKTAAKADAWIPVKPGTEGILALGMAHFIIKEGLYDKEFIENQTFGFEDWHAPSGEQHQGYKTLVMQHYSPPAVSSITGIPVESILRIAKEFATQGPSLAIGTRGDVYQQMAVHALNALAGNIQKPGGILTINNVPAFSLPAPALDETARRGLQSPPLAKADEGHFPLAVFSLDAFVNRSLQAKPYKVGILFFHNCNPLFTHHQITNLSQAIAKIPFTVSFSPYMNETALEADLILPDHASLEKWESDFTFTFQGYPVVGISKPVVPPQGNTRNTSEVIIEIAKGLDNSFAKTFPWKGVQEALAATMKDLYQMNKGDLFAPALDEALLRELVRRGWRAPGYKNFQEFQEGMQEKGGWWDPAPSSGEGAEIFKTPSRKFEFYSQILKALLDKRDTIGGVSHATLKSKDLEAQGDRVFLPHWESKTNTPLESINDYPFHLKLLQPLVFAASSHPNDPYLQDISSMNVKEKWHTWVEICPNDATFLGIKNGDFVWVESPASKLYCRAKITSGAMPKVVNIPLGLGHKAYGRWAQGIGEDARRLLTHHAEPFTGEPLMNTTRVKVFKAKGEWYD